MDTGFETRIDFSALNEKIGLLREQMARVIIGQRQVVDLLLTALLAVAFVVTVIASERKKLVLGE